MLSVIGIAAAVTSLASPASAATSPPVYVLGIPVDFILFALTLLGVAVFHHQTLQVALAGLAGIVLYKLIFTGFKTGVGLTGLALNMQHEAAVLSNLFLLLMGFALLSRHFENSPCPKKCPRSYRTVGRVAWLCSQLTSCFRRFLDNIAAALIGGAMARHVFHGTILEWKPDAPHKQRVELPAIQVTMGNAR